MKKIIVFLLLVLLTGCTNVVGQNSFEIDFINVGQGDATLIMSNGHNLLIDCGDYNHGTQLDNYLQEKQINKIDLIICTHSHEDHIGGMKGVVTPDREIGKVYCPTPKSNDSYYKNLEEICTENNIKIKTLSQSYIGKTIELSSDVKIKILAVDSDETSENDSSAVLMITYKNEYKFLMMGDAEIGTMSYLCNNYTDDELKCNVMKIAHHGSDNAATDYPLLFKALPEYSIISVGADNKYNHPHEAVTKRLDTIGSTTYLTSEKGSIICTFDGENLNFSFR